MVLGDSIKADYGNIKRFLINTYWLFAAVGLDEFAAWRENWRLAIAKKASTHLCQGTNIDSK